MTNTELLKQKMEDSGYRFSWIAKQLNLSSYGLRKKVYGENKFYVEEMKKLCEILKINEKEKEKIFFQKWQHFKRNKRKERYE